LNLFRVFFYAKANILGIQAILAGTYNRHARTRAFIWRVGARVATDYSQKIIYDSLSIPTAFGVISVQF
jgi:hypothetical protein